MAICVILLGSLIGGAKASQGQLRINNALKNVSASNFEYNVGHVNGASEGYIGGEDFDYDHTILSPNGYRTKLISEADGHELELDARPVDNTSVDIESSLHSQSGNPITINSGNEFRCSMPYADQGYNFGTKPITLQQYDPCDPNACYPEYDVRKVINLEGGVITLPDLDGTYNSEEPYAYFGLAFDKYHTDLNGDQKVNFEDFAIFAGAWQRTGITLADRQTPADLGAYADYDLDGDVDTNDLCIFTGRWLWDQAELRF